jgi:hypothetical protein
MKKVRRGHADDMNVVALQHLIEIIICAFDAELFGGTGACAFKRIGHGDDARVGQLLIAGNMYATRNAARTDNADADCLRCLVRVARVALAAVLPPLTAWEVEVFATNSIPLLL